MAYSKAKLKSNGDKASPCFIKISAEESIGLCESKSHKPWFDEECLKLVDQRKQAKLQWVQDPSEVNKDNLSNVRSEARRHFKRTTKGNT
jgi:hypothetical protein